MKLSSTFASTAVGGFAAATCYYLADYLYPYIITDDPMADPPMDISETFWFSPLIWTVAVIFAMSIIFTQMCLQFANQTWNRDSSSRVSGSKPNPQQLQRSSKYSDSASHVAGPKRLHPRSENAQETKTPLKISTGDTSDRKENVLPEMKIPLKINTGDISDRKENIYPTRSRRLSTPKRLQLSRFLTNRFVTPPQEVSNGTEGTGDGLCAILQQLFRDITSKRQIDKEK